MDLIKKTRDDYNKIAKLYADTRYHAGELVQFKPLIEDGQYILDWGCGNARFMYLLRDYNIHYVGLDQSEEILKLAEKEFAPEVASGKARFVWSGEGEVVFPENYFDRIFLLASFHHLPDKTSRLACLKKLYTELKLHGKIIISVWNLESDWAKEKYDKNWKVMGENDFLIPWKDKEGNLIVERYYHHFSEEELRELIQEAGFHVEQMYFAARDNVTDKKGGKNLIAIAEK